MTDVNLEYTSSGFQAVNGELKSLESSSRAATGWLKPMQSTLESIGSSGRSAFGQVAAGAKEATGSIWSFIEGLTKVGAVITTINGLLAGAGVFGFAKWSEGMLKATESGRTLEASLKAVLGTQEAFQKVSDFAKGTAAGSSDTTRTQVLETAKRFSLLPGTQPIYEQGNTQWMQRIENIVHGFSQMYGGGRENAEHVVQQALGGMWRPFQMQTGVKPEALAQRAGMGKEEMESTSLNTLKALEVLTRAAPQITTLEGVMNKLRGSYKEWLEQIGNTGIYDKVLGYMGRLNEFFNRLFSGGQGKGMATALSQAMEAVADGISKIFTKGIDWDKITNLSGAIKAFEQVAKNAAQTLKDGWDAHKDSISEALTKALEFAAGVVIGSAKIFLPVGKEIASKIVQGIKDEMAAHPVEAAILMSALGFVKAGVLGAAAGLGIVGGALADEAARRHTTSPDSFDMMGRRIAGGPQASGLARPPVSTVAAAAAEYPPYEPGPWSPTTPKDKLIANPRQMLLEQRAQMVGSWAGMAGKLAEATGTETTGEQHDTLLRDRRVMRDKWTEGTISDEEWKPFMKKSGREEDRLLAVSGFQTDYLSKMQGLVSTPGATPAFQSQMFSQMSGISMQRGEMGPAKDYMSKSLEALAASFKDDKARAEKQLAAEEATAKAAQEIAADLKSKNKESQAPGATSSPSTEKPTPSGASSDRDELKWAVRGEGTWSAGDDWKG